MLKLGRVTKVRVLFLVLLFVFNFDLFKFSAAIFGEGSIARIIFINQVISLMPIPQPGGPGALLHQAPEPL